MSAFKCPLPILHTIGSCVKCCYLMEGRIHLLNYLSWIFQKWHHEMPLSTSKNKFTRINKLKVQFLNFITEKLHFLLQLSTDASL